MLEKGIRHLLLSGDRLLGYLEFDGIAYPSNHITAVFTPTEAFAEVRGIFEAGGVPENLIIGDDRIILRRALERSEDAWRRMDRLDLRIVDLNGAQEPVEGFVLNGDRAVFRYGCFREVCRRAKLACHDEFWNQLEEEVGPDECRESGCRRMRIGLSIYCKRHHFRMIMREEYEGSMGDR